MDPAPQIKIEQFGKEELHFLRMEIQNSLDKIKFKYGFSELNLQTITFNRSSFTAKIIGSIQENETDDFIINEIKFFALRHGLPLNLIGCGFMMDGAIFKIIKVEFRNRKFPVIAKCKEDSRTFKFTIAQIKEFLEKHRVIDIA